MFRLDQRENKCSDRLNVRTRARFLQLAISIAVVNCLFLSAACFAESRHDDIYKSFHFGTFSSTGADLVGYRTISPIVGGIYSYYSFGIPSIASVGLSFYENYRGDGIILTGGYGVATLFNASASYQWKIKRDHFIEVGAGYGLLFEGQGFIPIISYVIHR